MFGCGAGFSGCLPPYRQARAELGACTCPLRASSRRSASTSLHDGDLRPYPGEASRGEAEKRRELPMMGWYGDGPGWAGWIAMTLMMLAFWGLLIFGGIALYRSANRDDRRPDRGKGDAEQLLDERFARGEIDAEDYRQRRELLHSGR